MRARLSPAFFFSASEKELLALKVPAKLIAARHKARWQDVDGALAWLDAGGRALLWLDQAGYPPLLAEAPAPPIFLLVAGDVELLSRLQLAVVGTRKPSPGTRGLVDELLGPLVAAGLVITSGLALGVDGLAHQCALDHGGKTLAVLGTGPDICYPRRHQALFERLAEEGALVSEFLPGTPPLPFQFPRRNRIIAGLAMATLVVEAGLKSGSLITARLALDAGREVMAVPGAVRNPQAAGCLQLLKDGAQMVTEPVDIVAAIGPLPTNLLATPATPTVQAQLPYPELLDTVGDDTTPIDVIVARSRIGVDVVLSQLLELETMGYVSRVPGGYVRQRRQ
ncbi:DNA-processing protein DprA [Gallaecimonas sp. GXIMD4217]|uniref:DNA-processing protein DprA n=1 Tax=Gallaecimonas sp. GXIMD4217 TaxID=3131927 RepID=UPI00311AF709